MSVYLKLNFVHHIRVLLFHGVWLMARLGFKEIVNKFPARAEQAGLLVDRPQVGLTSEGFEHDHLHQCLGLDIPSPSLISPGRSCDTFLVPHPPRLVSYRPCFDSADCRSH
jgi:hypothetical protein